MSEDGPFILPRAAAYVYTGTRVESVVFRESLENKVVGQEESRDGDDGQVARVAQRLLRAVACEGIQTDRSAQQKAPH